VRDVKFNLGFLLILPYFLVVLSICFVLNSFIRFKELLGGKKDNNGKNWSY